MFFCSSGCSRNFKQQTFNGDRGNDRDNHFTSSLFKIEKTKQHDFQVRKADLFLSPNKLGIVCKTLVSLYTLPRLSKRRAMIQTFKTLTTGLKFIPCKIRKIVQCRKQTKLLFGSYSQFAQLLVYFFFLHWEQKTGNKKNK